MASIRILGISGSPRDGSTAYVLRQALEHAQSLGEVETVAVMLKGKDIGFCLHCDYCVRTKRGCIQKDDVSAMYPDMEAADAWVMATPVYQGSVSAQLKAVMDRCRAIVARNPEALANKAGAAIAVGGDRMGGQEPAIGVIHAFYLANKMIPVSGGPFGSNLGGTIWSRDKGADGAGADRTGLKSTRRTMERLVEVARMLKEGGHEDD
jgi:multimeric flavodoxin WrbA